MKRVAGLLLWILTWLLKLYPPGYRMESEEERSQILALVFEDAARGGFWNLILHTFRELRDMPGDIMRAYMQESKGNMDNQNNDLSRRRRRKWAIIAVFLPFIFAIILGSEDNPLLESLNFIAFPLILIMLLSGLFKGSPRWSLLILGLFAFFLAFYGILYGLFSNYMETLAYHIRTEHTWTNFMIFFRGIEWMSILVVSILLVVFVGVLPKSRDMYVRVRKDWSLISFIIYGAGIFQFIISADEYNGNDPYFTVAMGAMAAGAWFYLRLSKPWPRLLVLLIGLVVATAAMAIGKWFLVPVQDWGIWPKYGIYRLREALSDVIHAGWIAVALILPGFLHLRNLPRKVQVPSS